MRVLMTGDTVGGVFTYACELTRGARGARRRRRLALTGRRLGAGAAARAPRLAAPAAIFADELALEWMQDPWDDVERAGAWLLEIAAELEPDVVHLNDYAHGALAWQAPVLVVGHSCVLSWHAGGARRTPRRVRGTTTAGACARACAAPTLVAAPTRAMLAELRASLRAARADAR